MADTVKVDIGTAITHRGIAYGPGAGIEVPTAVAEKHGLTGDKKTAKAETKSTKRGAK